MQKKSIILIIFCYIAIIGTAFFSPLIIKGIMDEGMMKKNFQIILVLAIILVILALLEQGINVLQAKLFADLQNTVILNLYTKVFQKLLYTKMEYFSHNSSAEIINRLSTDIDNISTLVDSGVMSIVGYVLQIISGVIGLFVIDWRLAVLVLMIVPVKYLLIRSFARKKEEAIKQWIGEASDFSAWFGDIINGIREVKLWNLYDKKRKELKEKERSVLRLRKRNNMLETYNLAGDSVLQEIVIAVLYGVGGYMICGGDLSIGSITAFLSYSNYVIGPISIAFNLKFMFAQVKPSAQRLQDFFKQENEEGTQSGGDILQFQEEISFENVSFSYADQPTLRNINIKIHKGEKIAIIGDNGSGKTTLISLLLRFLDPQNGNIYMDGTNIDGYSLKQYRNLFSVVGQDIYLFKDTVRNNLTMGKKISNEELERMCEMMDMRDFIDQLPNGYDTLIEQNGENLSGGERQKIALLRAIIKKAPIIILDEATANIDKRYSKLLQHHILKEFSDKTFIVITHKTENLAGMNRVYQIKNHEIKECFHTES